MTLPPGTSDGDRLAQSSSALVLDFSELGPHGAAAGLPDDLEAPAAPHVAEVGKAQEGEGFRFSETALATPRRNEATGVVLLPPGADQTRISRREPGREGRDAAAAPRAGAGTLAEAPGGAAEAAGAAGVATPARPRAAAKKARWASRAAAPGAGAWDGGVGEADEIRRSATGVSLGRVCCGYG